MSNRLIETDEGWSIAHSDAQVGYIHVDYRLGLDISDTAGTVRLVVETPCKLRIAGDELTIVPDDAATLAPILMLFNVGVEEIAIHRNGELTVEFSNGRRLNVSPSDQYEAWQIACENEFLIVCQPGGAVSIFQESAPEL
jgi:hypothetical protein